MGWRGLKEFAWNFGAWANGKFPPRWTIKNYKIILCNLCSWEPQWPLTFPYNKANEISRCFRTTLCCMLIVSIYLQYLWYMCISFSVSKILLFQNLGLRFHFPGSVISKLCVEVFYEVNWAEIRPVLPWATPSWCLTFNKHLRRSWRREGFRFSWQHQGLHSER